MNNEIATYEDRSTAQRKDAIAAGVSRIVALQQKIDDSKDDVETAFVSVVNAMRAQGMELIRMADREQVSFSFFNTLTDMPFDFDTAKSRVSLCKKMPKAVKTFEEARDVYRSVLEQMNLLQVEEVAGGGNHGVSHDAFGLALNSFVLIKQKFQKAIMLMPIEKCAPDLLKTIVADTQWAVEINAQARLALSR
jgi:hypothetical protein